MILSYILSNSIDVCENESEMMHKLVDLNNGMSP